MGRPDDVTKPIDLNPTEGARAAERVHLRAAQVHCRDAAEQLELAAQARLRAALSEPSVQAASTDAMVYRLLAAVLRGDADRSFMRLIRGGADEGSCSR